jgi:hypothetical protein
VIISTSRLTILNSHFLWRLVERFALLAAVLLGFGVTFLPAQTISTGSIVGLASDPQGKAVAGAKVEIRDNAKAAMIHVTTSSEGWYSSGPIQPGSYSVRVDAKGFNATHLALAVRVGNTTTGSVTMQPGSEGSVIEGLGATAVNIEQATVQSVLNAEQVERLPINGRNFFDLGQLEPGIQIQDGSVFGPTKNGVASISFLGMFGRMERVEVDGADVTDETVGATTQNIPASTIQEFQLAQSFLDLSTGLTSAGAVNVITRSGSDQLHGEAFGVFRGDQGGASQPGTPMTSFQREQYGANAGGAIIKDKVFWFADAERSMQNLTSAEAFTPPFDGLNIALVEPYREFSTDERVDWNMRGSTRAFYRFNFFQNNDVRPLGSASSTQEFRNDNNTLTNALGVDFNTGVYAHSLRFEYLKLRSSATNATSALSGVDNPIPGLGINIGASTAGNCILSDGGNFCGGPGGIAPQREIQSDEMARYDGTRVWREHIFRYGIAFNHIDGERFAAASVFPQVGTTSLENIISPNPTSYPADWVTLGNGVGFSTAHSSFGFPGGGLGPDNRLEMYVGDGWKFRPRWTFTYGLHYVRDTGRTDSDLGPLPALNQWGSGFGNQVRNPNRNFAPQAGFAWDAGGNGKTVVRVGGGLFYDNSLWNKTLLDSPSRLAKGIFSNTPEVCSEGVAAPFAWPTSLAGITSIAGGAANVVETSTGLQARPTFCGGTISTVAPQILALSGAYQAAAASVAGTQPNPAFVGTTLSALNSQGADLFFPGYRTPRSWQMNFGFQKEVGTGTIISIDYVRNIGEHFLIAQDINHSGAARSFNQANAVAARDAAQTANGCPAGIGQATCMIAALGQAGAQAAYSTAGLDSNLQTTGGGPCSFCAFPGTNPVSGNIGTVGGVDMQFPVGRSVYSGVQAKLVQRIDKPMRGVKSANFQLSYTLSRFISQAADQGSLDVATDNDDPTRFRGPDALDRKHQISFAGTFNLPFYTRFSLVARFYSPLPQNLELPELTHGGEIFATDWLGAGLGAAGAPEPLPNTQIGQFEHGTNIDKLQSVITSYNHNFAGTLTPAGECLVANSSGSNPFTCPGLISGPPVMTASDMSALGWVMPTIASVGPQPVGIPWLKSMDAKVSWPLKIKERVTIEPSASIFNVLNFWNAFPAGNLPSAALLPGSNGLLAPNVVGGVSQGSSLTPFRTSFQSGTYALGTPRQFEFGLRISF